jgi:lipopolysaccharide transport system ATP-binding protein
MLAVQANNLGKCYHIYERPLDRLKQSVWRGRRKFYREFWALRNVGLEVKRGETVGVIGSNGSGKSTLLQLICGILRPNEGALGVNGRIASLLELGAGFNPEFTGRENVYMTAAIMGLTKSETDRRYQEIVDFAGIGNFISQPVKTYSSGMFVRLAFAAAANVSPDILVIDEVLAVGDVRFQQRCMRKIRAFCRSGTVILVSHDMSAITDLCDRVLWIERGTIRMDGTPKFVVEKYLEYMYEGDSLTEALVPDTQALSSEGQDHRGFLVGDVIRQFGDRRVIIESVRLLSHGCTNSIVHAGERCDISVGLHAHEDVARPIVGYVVKDRLGREILGDNTALMRSPLAPLSRGKRYQITFRLPSWPNLTGGDYSLSVAVADGTFEDHVQCHWLHDAVVFQSIPLRRTSALFSIPDTTVSFQAVGNERSLER